MWTLRLRTKSVTSVAILGRTWDHVTRVVLAHQFILLESLGIKIHGGVMASKFRIVKGYTDEQQTGRVVVGSAAFRYLMRRSGAQKTDEELDAILDRWPMPVPMPDTSPRCVCSCQALRSAFSYRWG